MHASSSSSTAANPAQKSPANPAMVQAKEQAPNQAVKGASADRPSAEAAQTPPAKTYNLWQRLLAEAIGTFGLIFIALGSIAMHEFSAGAVGHGGISAAFGLAVMSMIYMFGAVSGAHINPAVTIGFALAGRFHWNKVLPYIAAQTVGGLAGSVMLRLLFEQSPAPGMTIPHIGVAETFALETIITAALMLLILRVSSGSREEGITAAIAIGAYVGLAALWAGPACGASMNPVRSLAPALMAGDYADLWIYLVAPVLGAALAVGVDRALRPQHQN